MLAGYQLHMMRDTSFRYQKMKTCTGATCIRVCVCMCVIFRLNVLGTIQGPTDICWHKFM